jgi:hypothetical protein
MREDTALLLTLGKAEKSVGCAPCLEGANLLQILGLDNYLSSDRRAEEPRGEDRGSVDVRANALGRNNDILIGGRIHLTDPSDPSLAGDVATKYAPIPRALRMCHMA